MKRVERVRLYPNRHQQVALRFALDVTRELYNALLQQRRDAYRLRGIKIASKQQYAEITALRRAETRLDQRIAAVYRECEDTVLHRLDLAFAAFFRRIRRGETAGFPRYKAASRRKQLEFSHGGRAVRFNSEQSRVRIPGVGSVRMRKGRPVPPFGRAWVIERNGRWWACFEIEREVELREANGLVIGVDRGVHVLAATSDGVLHRAPALSTSVSCHQRELEAVHRA